MEEGRWRCTICATDNGPAPGPTATGFSTVAGGREFRHPPYRVGECAGCGAFAKTARLADDELEAYYRMLEPESFESDTLMPPDRRIVQAAAALPPGGRILDYGCGVGRSLLPSVGRHHCFGVEPAARAAQVARGRGIAILADADLDRPELAGSFDLAVLSDVYEHLARPLEVLGRVARCLKPGARLVLVTGLAEGAALPERLAEFWYFRIAGHLHMASVRHLHWLAQRTGLALAGHERLCHYDPDPRADFVQRVKHWAYAVTHADPPRAVAPLVRALPVLGRAAGWSNAPMLSCGADHVCATYARAGSAA